MARYVDIDKLAEMARAKADTLIEGKQAFGYVAKWLDLLPTADVAEVKHGEWLEWYPPKEYILTGEEMLYCCSVCDAKYSDVEGYKHCPFCGAKMNGGKI